jgi:recombination protein RecR
MLQHLINLLATLPGLGPRSAKRVVLHLLKNDKKLMLHTSELLQDVASSVVTCSICNTIDTVNPCAICNNPSRDNTKLCVIDEIGDLWNIESSNHYNGLYYVLGGELSTSNFSSPTQINIDKLITRIITAKPDEIILANNATVAGQTTAFFILDNIEKIIKQNKLNITVTALGQGIPIGSEIDYLDESTIGAAFKTRKSM